jgi:hypothetical protein
MEKTSFWAIFLEIQIWCVYLQQIRGGYTETAKSNSSDFWSTFSFCARNFLGKKIYPA